MKRTAIFIFFLLFSAKLMAQTFYGGALGGFNASQIDVDFLRGYNRLGANVGAWVHTNLENNFFMGMEIKFSQKGSHKRPTKNDPYWYLYRLNYIDLPVIIGYQYEEAVSAFAGVSFNYLANSSAKNYTGKLVMDDYIKAAPWEIGGLLGVKVDFERLVSQPWAQRTTLDFRFQYSLFSVTSPHWFFLGNLYYGQFNNVISTTLYYRFDYKNN
jgi:hypothetical protein